MNPPCARLPGRSTSIAYEVEKASRGAAAIDGHPRVKELLAGLLRCRTPGTDEDVSPPLRSMKFQVDGRV
jgi:hypothetical protein